MSMTTVYSLPYNDAMQPPQGFPGDEQNSVSRYIWHNGARAARLGDSFTVLEQDPARRDNRGDAGCPSASAAAVAAAPDPLSERQATIVAVKMMTRFALRPERGPGRRQIAAWVGLSPELVVRIAQDAGLSPPHDRPLRHYKSARYLSHDQRGLIVRHYVAQTPIEDIASLVDRTRTQLLSCLRRMGLPYGRGGSMRAALWADLADRAVGLGNAEADPESAIPSPGLSRPAGPSSEPSQSDHRRKRARARSRSPRPGRQAKPRCPSPLYPAARADKLLTSFVAQVGSELDSTSLARLMTAAETVYRAASNPDFRIEKPARGIPPLLRECFGVLYVASVSPDGCARIVGVSRHVVARIFSNYGGRSDAEYGRSSRAVWPGRLSPGFDLAQISQSYGAQNFVFKKCLNSGILFPVRRTEISSRHIAPHIIASAHGYEGYSL